MKNRRTVAIILAAGSGTRMNSDVTKQHILIDGVSVLSRSIAAFEKAETIDEIVVVARAGEFEAVRDAIADCKKPVKIVAGGSCRAESAKKGFEEISKDACFVAIHDAARCLISPQAIDLVVTKAYDAGSAFAAASVTDTIKMVDETGKVVKTIPRASLVIAQTPQVFNVDVYRRALENTPINIDTITDDNMLVESIGECPKAVDIGETNIKITTPSDVEYVQFIIAQRRDKND